MSLLDSTHTVELPFESETIETYALSNNFLLVFNDKWDYIMWDGLRGEIMFQGKFPEDEEHSSILSIYSNWFTQLSREKILYYSPTRKSINVYNFLTAEVVHTWPATFEINPKFNFFNLICYYPEDSKCRVLHMIEFTKAAVHDIFENGEVKEVTTIDIINANCVFEQNKTYYFASQAIESNNAEGSENQFEIHTLNNKSYGKIIFQFTEDCSVLDLGFLKDNIMFILYNSNQKADSGIFLINISEYDYASEMTFYDKGDNCQKLTLQGENDPEIFDGRIIIDKILQTLTVTGMVLL